VTVSTSKGVGTTSGDVKVTPASFAWTEFNVSDVDGMVKIAARKGDLTIDDGNSVVTLQQGQETTRDEQSPDNSKKKDKKKRDQTGAAPAAGGGILNSPYAIAAGGAVIAGITTWVLVKSNNPASPTQP
jgi:hypothetical protein